MWRILALLMVIISGQIGVHGQVERSVYPVAVSNVDCARELLVTDQLEFTDMLPESDDRSDIIIVHVHGDACTVNIQISARQAAQQLTALSPVLAATLADHTHQISASPMNNLMLEGLAAYGAGNCAAALDVWGSVITPVNAFYRANCLLLDDKVQTATDAYQIARILLPDAQQYLPVVHLAWLHIDAGNEATAANIITQQLTPENTLTDPQHVDLLAHRAQLHALLYDYTSAIADVEAALNIAPDNSQLFTLLGQMHLLTYEWDAAEAAFDQAIALEPSNAEAYFRRGTLLYTMARREDAADDFRTYLDMRPEGTFADLARDYIASIETELEALEPPS